MSAFWDIVSHEASKTRRENLRIWQILSREGVGNMAHSYDVRRDYVLRKSDSEMTGAVLGSTRGPFRHIYAIGKPDRKVHLARGMGASDLANGNGFA